MYIRCSAVSAAARRAGRLRGGRQKPHRGPSQWLTPCFRAQRLSLPYMERIRKGWSLLRWPSLFIKFSVR